MSGTSLGSFGFTVPNNNRNNNNIGTSTSSTNNNIDSQDVNNDGATSEHAGADNSDQQATANSNVVNASNSNSTNNAETDGNATNTERDDGGSGSNANADEGEVADRGEVDGGGDAAAADYEDEDDEDDDNRSETWSANTMEWFDQVKNDIDESLKFTGRGDKAEFKGELPLLYRTRVSPSVDPEAFHDSKLLGREDFCLPDLYLWLPEALHQRLYPTARPRCPWHRDHNCVVLKGWVKSPRHCYDRERTVALLGKKYRCKIRQETKTTPFYFRGYDSNAIAASPDYIKALWKKNGFDISHRAAISYTLLETLRSDMLHALSVSGFRDSLLESAKHYHFLTGIQWRSYVDSISPQSQCAPDYMFLTSPTEYSAMKQHFYEFDSDEYDQNTPSVSYLISRVVRLMESESEYQSKRMQMVDGKHLSGDHSFKLTKCILSNGTKTFTAMYTL